MKKKLLRTSALLLCTILLYGCAPQKSTTPAVPTEDSNAAGTILAGADEAKNIKAEAIKSIALVDLEGKPVKKDLNKEDIAAAYNKSAIDDTSYIEMIAGYQMTITLKDDTTINITSYGSKDRVVASHAGTSYHLISPELAKILLDK